MEIMARCHRRSRLDFSLLSAQLWGRRRRRRITRDGSGGGASVFLLLSLHDEFAEVKSTFACLPPTLGWFPTADGEVE